jgi:hypothetical protein
VTFRSYGEFGHRGENEDDDPGQGPVVASVPGLEGHMSPLFPPWNLAIPDGKRDPKLHVISLGPALAEAIRRIHEGESVSALFDAPLASPDSL